MKAELDRRQNLTAAVLDYLQHRPNEWVDAPTLAKVGGFCGWRSRISQGRRIVERAGKGTIQWNGDVRASAYRFVAQVPLGRSAEQPVQQVGLF